VSADSKSATSPDRGANYHSLWAKTTRKVLTQAPIYRVECSCGWESDWTTNWDKSLTGHVYREQKKAAA
jgi:hypothetical protein